MAKTKQKGSSRLGRDSISKRLGVKIHNGEKVKPGMIIVRQRGTRYWPGNNVKCGKDDTLYAMTSGIVRFTRKKKIRFDGRRKEITVVSVETSK